MIVYLWDAGSWCGVSMKLEDAEKVAGEHRTDHTWIDEARPVYDNMQDLVRTYEKTGRTWTAQGTGPDGSVYWAMSVTGTPFAGRA